MALSHDPCYSILDIRLLLDYYDSYSSVLWYSTLVMSVVICVVGLVGNAIVICVIGFIMKKYKSKYWFLNLAIADFLSLLFLPLHTMSVFKGTWTFGPHVCKLFLFSLCANMYASIYTLTALNIARVLSVAQPIFHLKFISQRVSFWICIFIWIFTALISLPVLYYAGEVKIGEVKLCSFLGCKTLDVDVVNKYNVSYKNATRDISVSDIYTRLSPYIQQCSSATCCGGEGSLDFWNHLMLSSKQFIIPLLIIGYFIPLAVVLICNITIVVHVRNSRTVNTHRLYRIILVIIIVYFITRTPVVITETVILFAVHNMNLIAMLYALILMPLLINIAYINSYLNPIVYVLSGGQMQAGLSDFTGGIRNIYK